MVVEMIRAIILNVIIISFVFVHQRTNYPLLNVLRKQNVLNTITKFRLNLSV